MKLFAMLQMPILLGCLGAALILTPSCKAQSEIDPDHFDGADSWEAVNRTAVFKTKKPNQKLVALQARSRKAAPVATAQLTAALDLSKPRWKDVVAIQQKRETSSRKSKKQ